MSQVVADDVKVCSQVRKLIPGCINQEIEDVLRPSHNTFEAVNSIVPANKSVQVGDRSFDPLLFSRA